MLICYEIVSLVTLEDQSDWENEHLILHNFLELTNPGVGSDLSIW